LYQYILTQISRTVQKKSSLMNVNF